MSLQTVSKENWKHIYFKSLCDAVNIFLRFSDLVFLLNFCGYCYILLLFHCLYMHLYIIVIILYCLLWLYHRWLSFYTFSCFSTCEALRTNDIGAIKMNKLSLIIIIHLHHNMDWIVHFWFVSCCTLWLNGEIMERYTGHLL